MLKRQNYNFMVIGIVGKVGAGKSKAIKYIKEHYIDYDIVVFSCDDIAKVIMDTGKSEYRYKDIRPYDFFTNEKYQKEAREKLHPVVFKEIEKDIVALKNKDTKNEKKSIYIIESALPSELMYEMCDKVICIKSTYESSLKRLVEKREYSENQSKLIFDSQKFYEKYYDKANYIIENNGSKSEFIDKINEVMDEICVICK